MPKEPTEPQEAVPRWRERGYTRAVFPDGRQVYERRLNGEYERIEVLPTGEKRIYRYA
jgi:hypothetical protein